MDFIMRKDNVLVIRGWRLEISFFASALAIYTFNTKAGENEASDHENKLISDH
jgi:hypothetical protein